MDRRKFIIGVFVLLAVLAFISAAGPFFPGSLQKPKTASEEAGRPENLSEKKIAEKVQAVLNSTAPEQYELEWEPESETLTIDYYLEYFTAEHVDAALQDIKYLHQWNDMLASMQDVAAQISDIYAENGHSSVHVVINLHDPVDFDLLLATVTPSGIAYDVVAEMEPGQTVSGKRGAA